jgi:hypothetical protein
MENTMKKILAGLLMITVFAVMQTALGVGNTAPTAPSYGVRAYELDTARTTAAFDTINGTSDSSFLRQSWKTEPGWEYVLYCAAATDAGTGAPEFIVTLKAKDRAGSLIKHSTLIDTLTAASGGLYFTLPINRTLFAYQYDLYLKGGAANGADNHAVNQWGIYKVRTIYPDRVYR